MKYRTICPQCGHKFGPSYFFRFVTFVKHVCPSCGARIIKNLKWELVGNAILALPAVLAVLAFGANMLSLPVLILILVLTMLAGTYLFPYATKIDLVSKEDEDTQQ